MCSPHNPHFDVTGEVYTVPSDGCYKFCLQTNFDFAFENPALGGRVDFTITIKRNGINVSDSFQLSFGVSFGRLTLMTKFCSDLVAGDQITVHANILASAAIVLNILTNGTQFHGKKIH